MNNKIKLTIDSQYEGFCRDCFAHWITCLWGKYDDSFTFEENKEAFFYLLERLLREGKVKFENPFGDEPKYWEATPEVIVAHLKAGWPQAATTEGDETIVSFFYDDWRRCPPIYWLGPDGEWHGS
jgi:hypothetical protein